MLIYLATTDIGPEERLAQRLEEAGHEIIHARARTKPNFRAIATSDAVVMPPSWITDDNCKAEMAYAEQLRIPVYQADQLPALHPTEVKSPVQVKAFAETLGTMYRVHLDKNNDYSPQNIAAPGQVGLATRLWDKAARLVNLLGYQVEIVRAVDVPLSERMAERVFANIVQFMRRAGLLVEVKLQWLGRKVNAKNESIEDTLIDTANYAIIARLHRLGQWGH